MPYAYPTSDLQRPARLMAMLGNLWSEIYTGRAFINDRLQGVGDLHHQLYLNTLETVATLSRYEVPIFHRENWHPLVILESEVNNTVESVWKFDTGESFDASLNFDDSNGRDFKVPAPADLAKVSIITNRLTDPSVVMHKQQDFYLDGSAVVFRVNPFDNANIPQTVVFEEGVESDREIVLWLFRGEFDWELVYEHWGYVLGLQLESSEEYRKMLNAVLDAITGCSAKAQLESLVSLMADMPLSRNNGEVVEDIRDDSALLWIITDRDCYACSRSAVPAVTVGDVLVAGTPLITGIEKLVFNRGALDSDIAALVLTRGILAPEFIGELVFENKDVDVSVTSDKFEFEIHGHPNDVTRFWEIVHERRLLYGSSLYQLMRDLGPIPATVNPAQFLVEHVFRNNYVGYRIRMAQAGAKHIDANPRDLFRRIMPPRSALVLLFELPTLDDSVTINSIDDTGLATFDAMPTLDTDATPGNFDAAYFTSKIVNFTCY